MLVEIIGSRKRFETSGTDKRFLVRVRSRMSSKVFSSLESSVASGRVGTDVRFGRIKGFRRIGSVPLRTGSSGQGRSRGCLERFVVVSVVECRCGFTGFVS